MNGLEMIDMGMSAVIGGLIVAIGFAIKAYIAAGHKPQHMKGKHDD